MTFSTLASPGVSLQGGGGSGGGAASLPISGNGATVTASTPLVDGTQTWNNAAVTFTGLKFNVTDTASNAASLLMDLQVGGASRARLIKDGTLQLGGATSELNCLGVVLNNGTIGNTTWGVYLAGNSGDMTMRNTGSLAWTSGLATVTKDLILTRRGAANLRFGAADAAAPVAQTLSVQSVVAGTTDTAGANLTITGSQGTGTGAGGSIIFQVAPAGTTGTAQNTPVDALTIASTNAITVGANGTISFPTSATTLPSAPGIGNWVGTLGIFGTSGTLAATVSGSNINMSSTVSLEWGNDTRLFRDAANTLALRNGTAAQLFRVYSTFNGTNDAYGAIGAAVNLDGTAGDANTLYIGSQKKGSPTALTKLAIQVDGTTRLDYNIGNANQWFFATTVNVGGNLLANDLRAIATGSIYWNTRSQMTSPANGDIKISNLAETDFGRLMFGGITSSFPALKRVSANLQVIAADGTSSAGLIVGNQALATAATDGFLYVPTCAGTPTGTPTTQTGTVPIVVDTTNNKLYFYSNAAWRDAGP